MSVARASDCTSGACSRSSAVSAPAVFAVTASVIAGDTRISPRMARIALTAPMTTAISRSAAASSSRREAVGYGAIMIESPSWGSRCQISSVMNGMAGCSSRSVVSSVVTSVCCVARRRAGSSAR